MIHEGEIVPARKPRPRDPIWDGLVDHFDYTPATQNERGKWNVAVKQLREANATYEQVRLRCLAFMLRFPGATLTPTALANHWGALGASPSVLTRRQVRTVTDQQMRSATCNVIKERVGESEYQSMRAMQMRYFGMSTLDP